MYRRRGLNFEPTLGLADGGTLSFWSALGERERGETGSLIGAFCHLRFGF
jgi:hypothetical protein